VVCCWCGCVLLPCRCKWVCPNWMCVLEIRWYISNWNCRMHSGSNCRRGIWIWQCPSRHLVPWGKGWGV
jgi:hypothetical protein